MNSDTSTPCPFTLVCDTREQAPLVFPPNVPTIRRALKTGDYSISGYEDAFTVERKSITDIVNTVIHDRDRFERELDRMTAIPFRRLLIVAPWRRVLKGNYRFSMANGKAVMASIAAFEVRYGLPAVFVGDADEAARRIVWWAYYFLREEKIRRRQRLKEEGKV